MKRQWLSARERCDTILNAMKTQIPFITIHRESLRRLSQKYPGATSDVDRLVGPS